MMQIPAGVAGDLLTALRTDAVLLEPQPQQLIVSVKRVFHLQSDALLKVRFPCGQIRVDRGLDLDVTFDRHVRRLEEPDGARFPATIRERCLPDVVSVTNLREVLAVTPKQRFARMSAANPMLYCAEDVVVHVLENLGAG